MMHELTGSPKNQGEFVRLIEFFKEILELCYDLKIAPILDGSLAVFAYTGDQEISVNDIDLSCSERDFPKIMNALDARGVNYKLREWHVLQILKDDLKVELGSAEFWLKNLPLGYEILLIDDFEIQMLDLKSLTAFYKQGMADRVGRSEPNEKRKYDDLKEKYRLLTKIA